MVEIVFSNKKPRPNQVKVVLACGKLDKKYMAKFLSQDEIKLVTKIADRENFKPKFGQAVVAATSENKIVLLGCSLNPDKIELQKLGGNLYHYIKKYQSAVVYAAKPASCKIKTAEIEYERHETMSSFL